MYYCLYCNKQLSCQSALNRHIKTTRSCIKLQQAKEQEEKKQQEELQKQQQELKNQELQQQLQQQQLQHQELQQQLQQLLQRLESPSNKSHASHEIYVCEHCNKKFATKYTLRNHYIVCKHHTNTINNNNTDANTIKRDLEELKALITNPTPSVVQNMEPVTVAHIQAMALEHLDISDIEEGIDGIVDFTVKYPLQGRVICTDKARRKFRYTDENDNVINDFGGAQLSKTVFTGIQSRCVHLIDQRYNELSNDIKIAVDANLGYEDSVLANMKRGTELQNLKKSLLDAAQGIENDLQKSYIRKLVKELK